MSGNFWGVVFRAGRKTHFSYYALWALLGTECSCPPKFIGWHSNSHPHLLPPTPAPAMWWYWEVGLWGAIRLWEWSLECPYKEDPLIERPLTPLTLWGLPFQHQGARKRAATRQQIAQGLDLELTAARTVRNKCFLFKPQSLVFCLQQPGWTQIGMIGVSGIWCVCFVKIW